jgi:hypothetical protein
MTDMKLEFLAFIIVLLPGLVCARLVQFLCVRRQQTEFDKVVEALLYSFIVYLGYAAIVGGVPIKLTASTGQSGVTEYQIETEPLTILLVTGVAMVLAVLWAYLINNDLLGPTLRKVKLTQRTARADIWTDVFHELGGFVQVQLADGRQVIGWLRYYSDSPEGASLFLENGAWVGSNHEEGLSEIPGQGFCWLQNPK